MKIFGLEIVHYKVGTPLQKQLGAEADEFSKSMAVALDSIRKGDWDEAERALSRMRSGLGQKQDEVVQDEREFAVSFVGAILNYEMGRRQLTDRLLELSVTHTRRQRQLLKMISKMERAKLI